MSKAVTTSVDTSDIETVDSVAEEEKTIVLPQSPVKGFAILKEVVVRAIELLGNSKESLCAPWVGRLCVANAVMHTMMYLLQELEKGRFRTKQGQRKVATFGIMNVKYVGVFYGVLVAHIIGGTLSVVGSAASIYYEERKEDLSRKLALWASLGQTFLHAPTAIALSPIVYGDKGVTPFIYLFTSLLLQLAGLSALFESTSTEPPGPEGFERRRPEVRRMSTTIGIFLYVRLYAVMRGFDHFLSPQKYTAAVLTAGFTMMPIGWDRLIFPLTFWAGFLYNIKTVKQTVALSNRFGIDGTAVRQMRMLRK